MSPIDGVKTVVLVMMENRSFDHMLGHLSLEGINPAVEGLQAPLDQYSNLYEGNVYPAFELQDGPLPVDPPHEYTDVATQMHLSNVTEEFEMDGFVEALANKIGEDPGPRATPMGVFPSSQVPITTFLAQSYCTCDHWFSALPTSTQPNRTIAFTGDSEIFATKKELIPTRDTIFDWLDRAHVRWRVYHDGLTFFALYPQAWNHVLGPRFRDFEHMYHDLKTESLDAGPQVIIVEPTYEDAPHFGSDHPNDNHAPLAVAWGEEFLRRTYEAVRANPERWASTVMIVYYDEHGGFWDHVAPPDVSYTTTGDTPHEFKSLGPRIPGIVISPLVEAGAVCEKTLDHTSVLQLLAELFTPGRPYSATVQDRADQNVSSISAALTRATARADTPPAPVQPIHAHSVLGGSLAGPPSGAMQESFATAARELLALRPAETAQKYPELVHWRDLADSGQADG